MCLYCAEAMALDYLAADAAGWLECADLRNRWSEPILLQEGEAVPASVAPISAECLAMELRWIAGELWLHSPPSNMSLVGSWRPPSLFANATNEDRTAGLMVLRRYIGWARGLPPPGPPLWEGGYEKILTDSFSTVWAAWLLTSRSGSTVALRECAEALATTYFQLSDEALELWLQRRAAIALSDDGGTEELVHAVGISLRPQLVSYVATRR